MSTNVVDAPVVKPRRRKDTPGVYSEEDLAALHQLAFKTPFLERLLSDPYDPEDEFHRHLLDITIPKALAFNRIMTVHNGNPAGTEFRNTSRDAYAFVLPDASEVGRFRVQYFDANGFSSHSCMDRLDQAVLEMVTDGFLIEATGVLDRLSQTETWKRGMQVAALIQLLGSRQIDHAEFLRRQALLGPAKAA